MVRKTLIDKETLEIQKSACFYLQPKIHKMNDRGISQMSSSNHHWIKISK